MINETKSNSVETPKDRIKTVHLYWPDENVSICGLGKADRKTTRDVLDAEKCPICKDMIPFL